jgi:hypothetical protein
LPDRAQELADEVERLTLANAEQAKEIARLKAQLRDQPNPEQRVTRAMVRGVRDDVRILREQVAILFEELVSHDGETEDEEGAGPQGRSR